MNKMVFFLKRLYTFFTHPSTLFYYKNFKGTIFHSGTILKGTKYMHINHSIFARKCSIKTFNLNKKNKECLIYINNSYFGDNAYISSSGGLFIDNASFAPNVFIGSYKHSLTDLDIDSNYKITIDKPKFIGQNVSIFGNVEIGENSVIGACSVVTKNVSPNTMVVGNPAKIIKIYNVDLHEWTKAD